MPANRPPDERRRPERVAARIRHELATMLTRDLGDPRLAGVVLSAVEASDDLSIAHVFVVVMGDTDGARAVRATRVLQRMEGGLRKRLAPMLGMRRVPSLKFEVDRGRAEVERLDALMHEVSEELKGKGT